MLYTGNFHILDPACPAKNTKNEWLNKIKYMGWKKNYFWIEMANLKYLP